MLATSSTGRRKGIRGTESVTRASIGKDLVHAGRMAGSMEEVEEYVLSVETGADEIKVPEIRALPKVGGPRGFSDPNAQMIPAPRASAGEDTCHLSLLEGLDNALAAETPCQNRFASQLAQ